MKQWLTNYHQSWQDRSLIGPTITASVFLILALIVNYYAGSYATDSASNAVTDLILSNIPVFDVDGIFIYSTLVFWIFASLTMLNEPRRLPFALKSISLFVFVRSIFISLTHIGPYPTQLIIHSTLMGKFAFGGDLFFSGHTGLPFLLALIFWDRPRLRKFFLVSSVFFGIVVLLAHLHYSIDVLAAFFITYTIYHLSEKIFWQDRQRFRQV